MKCFYAIDGTVFMYNLELLMAFDVLVEAKGT